MSQRFDIEVADAQQLRNELREAGLEPPPSVAYDRADRWVEVDSDDPRVPSVVAGHTPDRRKTIPPERAELVGLIEQEEAGTLAPNKRQDLDRLLLAYVKEQILR